MATVNANTFAKCAPNLRTNIKQCGSVTLCNAKPVTSDELNSVYMKSNDYRVMEALLHHDMEIKMCEAVQNGLYDFFMANRVNLRHRLNTRRANSGLLEIAPFVLARQYSPINNEYWAVSGGTSAGAGDWTVTVTSTTNIPSDVRSFPVGLRVFIEGASVGGSSTKTQWVVIAVTDNGNNTLTLNLNSQNAASRLDTDKLGSPAANGTQALLRRGTPNVSDYEKFCAEPPAYLNWKNVPFWVETTRTSMCKSELYDKWRKLVMSDNALYREFDDLDEIEKNKQLANDWQRRLVNQMFFGKPLANQGMATFDELEEIAAYDGVDIGVEGGRCVGRRANAVGIYEQLAECFRIADLQGGQLNLPALFVEIYNMMRVRKERNKKAAMSFDIFTDSVTAELFNQAMIKYYNSKSDNTLRLTKSVDREQKTAEFGFMYESYRLFWPQGVTINIITHEFFDDYLTAAVAVGQENTARVLWVLDLSGIYPGIIASNRLVQETGKLKDLAAIDPNFACVMKVHTQTQTLVSLTWTMVVECPASNLIIENFDDTIPEHATLTGAYPGTHTSTTTTTQTPWTG